MSLKLINLKVKQLKDIVLNLIQNVVEPKTWEEFLASKGAGSGNFSIHDDDLPIIRDIKAFLNMLVAIERATDKLTDENVNFLTSFVKKTWLIQDYVDFKRNYKIYMSTTSILTQYLTSLKDTIVLILPQLIDKMLELSKLCTTENLEKAADFFIEQVIVLEQYQENYVQRKKAIVKKDTAAKKTGASDDFITSFVKHNDWYLQRIYEDKYHQHFKPQGKAEVKAENKSEVKTDSKIENKTESKRPDPQIDVLLEYYPENKDDTDVIKHIKLFMNGVIGIKKTLDDHESYQKADVISGISWMAACVSDLRRAYGSLQEFDYQAIIAEKAGPYTRMIKYYINILNDLLEQLACIADQFENEFRLKPGTLLDLVNLLVKRHNQITTELRINPEVAEQFENEFRLKEGSVSKLVVDLLVQRHNQIGNDAKNENEDKDAKNIDFKTCHPDYVKQKNIYYQARLRSRQNYMREIDVQINDLRQFLFYRNHALMDIPYYVIHAMQAYIKKYSDIICIENAKLEKYNSYLSAALYVKRGFNSFIISQLEFLANYWGWTIHYELMSTLDTRLQYLQKQKIFLVDKFEQTEKYIKAHPYYYLNSEEMAEFGTEKIVLKALQKHVDELYAEKEALLVKNSELKQNLPLQDEKSKTTGNKIKPVEEKAKTLGSQPSESLDPRRANQAKLKEKEYQIFKAAVNNFENSKSYKPLRDVLKKEDCLAPESVILIDEVVSVMCVEEQKSIRLD